MRPPRLRVIVRGEVEGQPMQSSRKLIEWNASQERLPGRFRVEPPSIYAGIADAVPVTPISILPGEESGPLSSEWEKLDGAWQRCIDPAQAETRSELDSQPPSCAAWQNVTVPENYGLDPELRFYFGPVWYRRRIVRPGEARWIDLRLDAVDYIAHVHLDGQLIGRHEGYFAPFHFDLSDRLPMGTDVELCVQVHDPLENLKDRAIVLKHRKKWIKGTMNYHDSRPGGPPGNTTPGWTFRLGQSMPTGGMTGPVSLRCTGPVRVDHLFVTPRDCKGNLHLAVVLMNRANASLRVQVLLTLNAPEGDVVSVHRVEADLGSGYTRIDLAGRLDTPRPWFDASLAELGQPSLYRARATVIVDGRPSSEASTAFGFRTAEFPMVPAFHYLMNGRKVYLRGVNYIPVQHWAGKDVRFYERDFRLLKAAHLHTVGLHGHIQSPACYEAADKAGISVFQDFPLCWGYASGSAEDPGFVSRAAGMGGEMAYLLWNHPSVVYYAIHNEPLYVLKQYFEDVYPFDLSLAESRAQRLKTRMMHFLLTRFFLPSQKTDTPERDGLNQQLDSAVLAAVRAVDPIRFIHKGSGAGFDWHDYTGTAAGGRVYDVGRIRRPFVSEYGSWPIHRTAVSHADAWAKPWPPQGQRLTLFCQQGTLWLETLEMVGDLSRYADLPSFAYASERKAAFVAKYQTEFFRIHRDDPYTGYRWHFFANWWGWIGSGLVDVDRNPAMSYEALARASRPRLIATIMNDTVFEPGTLSFPIYAINDSQSPWAGKMRWRMEILDACEVLTAEKSRHSSPLRSSVEGSYIMPLPGAEGLETDGVLTFCVDPNCTRMIGSASIALQQMGPYRFVMSWDCPAGVEENDYTILVAPAGWQARPGLTVVARRETSCP